MDLERSLFGVEWYVPIFPHSMNSTFVYKKLVVASGEQSPWKGTAFMSERRGIPSHTNDHWIKMTHQTSNTSFSSFLSMSTILISDFDLDEGEKIVQESATVVISSSISRKNSLNMP